MIREACRNNICGQTIFTGYVDWEQMYKLYSIADVFATASLSEIHPMTLIEASMCGLPVVARRDDAYVGLIEDDYNGYLVDTDAAIVERLSEILGDEAKLTELSENSLTLSDRFNAETHVEKLESLYRQILSNGAASL
jgi:1,2-diacylglycerol 3-alpha-glucosyltransferase